MNLRFPSEFSASGFLWSEPSTFLTGISVSMKKYQKFFYPNPLSGKDYKANQLITILSPANTRSVPAAEGLQICEKQRTNQAGTTPSWDIGL